MASDEKNASTPALTVIGYAAFDINICNGNTTTLPGGGAYFAALGASLETDRVGLVTRIGYDYDPGFLFSKVLREGIRIIKTKKTARSIQTYLSSTDLTLRDIRLEWGVAPDLVPSDIPKKWLVPGSSFHIATMPPPQQHAFIVFLRKKCPRAYISIDSDIYLMREKQNKRLIEKNFLIADCVFANRREYELMKPVIDHIGEAVIKYDKDGAIYLKKGKVKHQTGTKRVSAVDVTGAGDIFAGVFLASRINGQTVRSSLKKAASLATRSVTKIGVMHLFGSSNPHNL